MTKVLGAATVTMGLSANPLLRGLSGVMGAFRGFGAVALPLVGALGAVGAAMGLAGAAGSAVKLAAELEQTTVAMGVLLGSTEEAKALIKDLTTFAASTPFQMPTLNNAARQLLAFGFDAGQVMDILGPLGDLAAGTGSDLGDLSQIYGRIKVSGKAAMEDINRMTDRGIPILTELAAVMGVTEGEVRELVSSGKVGFPEVSKAIARMTDSGGQFSGMMEAQSKTTLGLVSTLKDNVAVTMTQIGERIIEAFNVQDHLTNLISFIQNTGPVIVDTVGGMVDVMGSAVGWLVERFSGFGRGVIIALSMAQAGFENTGAFFEAFIDQTAFRLVDYGDLYRHIFTVLIPDLLKWFVRNWKELLLDAYNFMQTVIGNMQDNIFNFFSAVASYLRGDGFDFKWTGLMEGFEATLEELPKIAERKRGPLAEALRKTAEASAAKAKDGFSGRLGELLVDRLGPGEGAGGGSGGGERTSLATLADGLDPTGGSKSKGKGTGGAGFVGLAEAFKDIQAAAFKDTSNPEARTAKATEQTKEETKKTADSAKEIKEVTGEIRNILSRGIPAVLL